MKIARENGCQNVSQIEPHFSSRFIVVLPFYGTDHPAISGLISDAGIQGQPVITAGRRAAGIHFRHLGNAGDGVSSRSQLCCVGDGIAHAEGMYLPKVVVHASVMSGNTDISVPDARLGKMACTLAECGTVRPFIDLDC